MNLYFVAGRAAIGLKMEKIVFCILLIIAIYFFWGWFLYREKNKDQQIKINLLQQELKKAEDPTEIWCLMRSKELAIYAAKVLITKDGREVPPIDPDKRILVRVDEIRYECVTPLTAPNWDPITSSKRSQYNEIRLFGAIYRYPKEKGKV